MSPAATRPPTATRWPEERADDRQGDLRDPRLRPGPGGRGRRRSTGSPPTTAASASSSAAASPPAPDGRSFATLNPATGDTLAHVAEAGEADVDRAVAAARKAQRGWAALPGTARAGHLYALARHLQKHARLFAVLETLDNGKTIRETRDIDVPLAVRHFYHHAGWAAASPGASSRASARTGSAAR